MMDTNDPVAFLKNEHKALLGQLGILERLEGKQEEIGNVLRTLIRDCTVHFRREALLINLLDRKLNAGGRSLHPLIKEHRELRRKAGELLKLIARPEGNSGSRGNAYLRPLLRELTKQFRTHMQHEEKVVFVLVRTRLTLEQQ